MANIIVVKRDGSKEDFIVDKLITSLVKAGCDLQTSEKIAASVHEFVLKNSKDGVIESSEIKKEAVNYLTTFDTLMAQNYSQFSKI